MPAAWAGLMILMLAGCARDHAPDPGIYRAVIEAPEGEIPFGLEISAPASSEAAPGLFLLEGNRRLEFGGVARVERALDAQLPGGKGSLTITARGAALSGYVRLGNGTGSTDEFALTAESGALYRFFREPMTDNADVAGRWSASIDNGNGRSEWVLVLTQSHDQVEGVFHGPGGLEQSVTGQVRGDDVRLSSFDGEVARLFSASVNEDGALEGEAWSNLTGSARWTASRNPDAVIESQDAEATPL